MTHAIESGLFISVVAISEFNIYTLLSGVADIMLNMIPEPPNPKWWRRV